MADDAAAQQRKRMSLAAGLSMPHTIFAVRSPCVKILTTKMYILPQHPSLLRPLLSLQNCMPKR